jgi:alpha-L-fucosidase
MTGTDEKKSIALARPTSQQQAWQDLELGVFIHFGPATWMDAEHEQTPLPLETFNPESLDTDQWVDVAASMGARYLMMVAKHVGGFCAWQTETSSYGVKETPWRGGKGDIMADLARSCAQRNIKLGVYLSPQDMHHGAGLGGRCPTPHCQQRYNAIFRQQLTELLTRYGEIVEIWFDGSCVVPVDDLIDRHAPTAIIFQGPRASIRWSGNESCVLSDPAWTAVAEAVRKSGVATLADGTPDGDAWLPIEADGTSRGPYWFWRTDNLHTLKSVETLVDCYYRTVGYGQVMLLNWSPDRRGLIPEPDAQRAAEFGAEIRRRFGAPLAQLRGPGQEHELRLLTATFIDHVVTMEDTTHGQRIRRYVIEGQTQAGWLELVAGTAIGHKKIDYFPAVAVAAVRLRVLEACGEPRIRDLAIYHAGAIPAPAHAPGVTPEYQALGTWDDQVLATGRTTLHIPIPRSFLEARRYRLAFYRPNQVPYQVTRMRLLFDGVEVPEFVTGTSTGDVYFLTVTTIGGAFEVVADLACDVDARPSVMVILHKD